MANRLKFNERRIEILVDRSDTESQLLASQIPYIHRNRINTVFTTSPRNIDLVLKLFRGINENNIDKTPIAVQQLYEAEMLRRVYTNLLLTTGPIEDSDSFLWRHQQLGVQLAQANNRFAFFYDTRTGKTPMSLQIIQDDVRRNPHHKWVVLCPLILIENAWLPDAAAMFPELKIVSTHAATKKKRLDLFKQNANVYICNIESFVTYRPEIEALKAYGCFVDESSTMKSNSSKFGKEAVEYAYSVNKWYLLSGTPAPNGEWEYYRQLQSIDFYGVHQSYSQFTQYFFDNVSRNPQYQKLRIKSERENELISLVQNMSLYVDKEDVLTTPGRDFKVVEIQMPDELKKHYTKLKNELYIELGENVLITAPSTAASLNKLNQVSSGFIMDTAAAKMNRNMHEGVKVEKEVHLLSMYRFDKLIELLNTFGDNQAIIWCYYREEFRVIKELLGDNCSLVYGGVNNEQKNKALRDFKSGKVQWLIANPASADKGLTLTNAHIAVYFSQGYSFEYYKQSLERIYGDVVKQPERCIYYTFIAKGTVDVAIHDTLTNKGDMSAAILAHLKGGI
ncbi:ATP-dependent RNA helicase DbpA [compost metagenome]